MRKRQITATGTIDTNGRLAMYMDEVNDFFRSHKGKKVIATFSVYESGTSEALRGYYYNYVVPTMRQAIWEAGERMTNEQAEIFIRKISPIMYEQTADVNTCQYSTRLREISELSNAELIEHIDTLKQVAAEEYNVYIEDPKQR